MKPALSKFTLALGIILMGALLSGSAFAGCGDQGKSKHGASLLPQSWSIWFLLAHFHQLLGRSDRRNVARQLHSRRQRSRATGQYSDR
jgi:hypothetical protein